MLNFPNFNFVTERFGIGSILTISILFNLLERMHFFQRRPYIYVAGIELCTNIFGRKNIEEK